MTSPLVVVVVFVASLGLSVAHVGAQTAAPLTIHNVTVQERTGVLTITGTGFGRTPAATVDGEPVTVLANGTDTRIEVLAPAALLVTPGTYRLTVVDPARHVGDAFVVASQSGTVMAAGGAATDGPPTALTDAAIPPVVAPVGPAARRPGNRAAERPGVGTPSPAITETGCTTAVGTLALISNTSGCLNTAIGYAALRINTSGSRNTASGDSALSSNTTGFSNTANGYAALLFNTAGIYNTASGDGALVSNTTGSDNTANGYLALSSNTTGSDNTANGYAALYSNTTGIYNAASGFRALYSNTIGTHNTAHGVAALLSNTIGNLNTATGEGALYLNTTGSYNAATGSEALQANTTGSSNTASGGYALYTNSTGNYNTALGFDAGFNATTGSSNVFLGADVKGTATDANTMRLGLPYSGGLGQNRAFMAGIHGTQLTGPAVPVFVDANGQLGVLTAGVVGGGGILPPLTGPQQAVLRELQATNAELRDRLARLEALLRAHLAEKSSK